jgi:outer membrane protein assembly factor BamD
MSVIHLRSHARLLAALLLAGAVVGCASKGKIPPVGQAGADKYLFDRGTALLAKKNWVTAREYFRRLVDSYPQSEYRAEAKLGIGDSYVGEKGASLILAVNEFREFLNYYPRNPKADYAQYRLAFAQTGQLMAAERDQTNTIEALKECQRFIDVFPGSPYRPEVEKLFRQARDRLSESEFRVGLLYYRGRWMPGAIARFSTILKDDPEYSKLDEVLFYMGEAMMRGGAGPQAVPYYERLTAEHPKSKYVKQAQRRLSVINKK